MSKVLGVALSLLVLLASACATTSADAVVSTSRAPAAPSPATTTTITVVTVTPEASQSTTTAVPQVDEISSGRATGVIVAVDGDLAAVRTFSILLGDGSTLVLVPEDGLLFDDSSPLSHVRDHLISGSLVLVEFHAAGEVLVATAVGDAE